MVNNEAFTIRIKKILSFYNLTATQFADKIGVQRSSISHLLSGRNKPSLDFVLKVMHQFNEIDLYWLLNGKGTFPKSVVRDEHNVEETNIIDNNSDLKSDLPNKSNKSVNKEKAIEHIIIFYKDGSFKKYKAD